MIRKILMVGAATAMPLGFVAATGGIAGAAAKPPPINVATDSVHCTTVSGSAKFSPALQIGGTTADTESLKVAVSGCTISGPVAATGITALSGSGKGTLSAANNNALSLDGASTVSGSVTIKWKATGAKLASTSSTIALTVVDGAVESDGYGSFTVPSGSATSTGDFAGTTSTLYAETGQSETVLAGELASSNPKKAPKGIKSVTLVGNNTGETTPASITVG